MRPVTHPSPRSRQALGGARPQRGVMLLEALIGVALFSIGILAVIAMQAAAVREVGQSKMRADASYLADRVIGDLSGGDIALIADGDRVYSAVSNPEHAWAKTVADPKTGLPNGSLRVVKAGATVTVVVSWQAPDGPHSFAQSATLVDI